mgnify:CR=1 FL=1
MDEVDLTQKFLMLMKPLVPKGKLALDVVGKPKRKNEYNSLQEILTLAKTYKLHKKKKHALSSITLNYEKGHNMLSGTHIFLKIDSLTYTDYMKRCVIISVLIITLLLLMITSSKQN